jgi:STE24 endopeptidase
VVLQSICAVTSASRRSDGPLRDRLLEVARGTGLPVRDIVVSDASRRTNSLSAYVSGIGRTRRIVVWDTTIEQCAPEEIAMVAAYELGHVARRDVVLLTVLGAVGAALAAGVVALALRWSWLLRLADVRDAADPAGITLVSPLGAVLGLVGTVPLNAVIRRVEARADRYAVDQTRDPAAAVATFRRLAVTAIADLEPGRLDVLWYANHPPIPARIAAIRVWADWHGILCALPAPRDPRTPDQPAATVSGSHGSGGWGCADPRWLRRTRDRQVPAVRSSVGSGPCR